eukprot:CAMPEP_0181057320 /NCGR_PEP_ID=MMETSP1070-20121207/20186_1 /TAXON_ID=265543 /ORGANISM="Minutocellus polymorphus, Strain NH13" /LENGTH=598 /DNA_ID=CAMNT_0023136723 /DNA_START=590 /DNA_END=2386 /DNA_ORIENTATION=-
MGNQPSSGGGGGNSGTNRSSAATSSANGGGGGAPTVTSTSLPTFRLPQFSTGSLKLSRAELDKRCQPSGLYPATPWDARTIRRLVGDGKLAARLRGTDARVNSTDQECPICFLHYAQVNITKCCTATVCTECYLQVRPQKEKNTAPCPFCNAPKVAVRVAKMMTGSQVRHREAEEQRIIAAQIEARKTGLTGEGGGTHSNNNDGSGGTTTSSGNPTRDSMTFGGGSDPRAGGGHGEAPSTPQPYRSEQTMQSTGTAPNTPGTPPAVLLRPGEFGAAIERYRSESFASSDGGGAGGGGGGASGSDAGSLTLTPTQRSQIHAELQSQNDHPLARQMAEEARRRREDNELEYYRAHSGRLLERYEEYQRSRSRQSRAVADRMLLQAHGIPTRGEAGFGSGGGGGGGGRSGGGGGPGATTILAPRNGSGNGGLDSMVIEAALMLSIEEDAERQRRREAEEGGDESGGNAASSSIEQPSLAALLSSSSRSGPGGVSGSRRRLLRARSGRGPSATHIGTAGMLMQGISEEDQVAMAIALSLREAETAQNDNDDDDGDGDDGGGAAEGSSTNTDGDDNHTGDNNSETGDAQDSNAEGEGVGEDRT